MPLLCELSSTGDRVRITATGEITTDECIGLVDQVMSDPRIRQGNMTLIDLCDAIYEPRDQAELVDIARALAASQGRLKNRIAIVARQAMLFFAEVVALHVREATHRAIRVFVDAAAAEEYLQGRLP